MIKPNIYEEKLERSFFIIFFKLEAIENLIYIQCLYLDCRLLAACALLKFVLWMNLGYVLSHARLPRIFIYYWFETHVSCIY